MKKKEGRGSVRVYDGGHKGGNRRQWEGGSGNGERREALLGSMMESTEGGNEGAGGGE